MKNRQSLLLWMLLFLGSVSVFAQHAVKGRITDAKTGEPLIGVNVVLRILLWKIFHTRQWWKGIRM